MVTGPVATGVARPAAVMVEIFVSEEDQVTELLTFWVLPSVNVPVAVNCCVTPRAMVGFAGVTAIELNAALLTSSVVVPVIDPGPVPEAA